MDEYPNNVFEFEQPDMHGFDINKILLATDGSDASVAATQYAIALAKTLGAKLKAIYVTPTDDDNPYDVFGASNSGNEPGPSAAGLTVASLYAQENGVDFESEIIHGNIIDSITAAARSYDADLLIIGNTGRTGFRRLAFGSVTEAVVRESRIPVLVLKGE